MKAITRKQLREATEVIRAYEERERAYAKAREMLEAYNEQERRLGEILQKGSDNDLNLSLVLKTRTRNILNFYFDDGILYEGDEGNRIGEIVFASDIVRLILKNPIKCTSWGCLESDPDFGKYRPKKVTTPKMFYAELFWITGRALKMYDEIFQYIEEPLQKAMEALGNESI